MPFHPREGCDKKTDNEECPYRVCRTNSTAIQGRHNEGQQAGSLRQKHFPSRGFLRGPPKTPRGTLVTKTESQKEVLSKTLWEKDFPLSQLLPLIVLPLVSLHCQSSEAQTRTHALPMTSKKACCFGGPALYTAKLLNTHGSARTRTRDAMLPEIYSYDDPRMTSSQNLSSLGKEESA